MTILERERERYVDPEDLKGYATMLAAQIDVAYMSRWLNTKDPLERKLLEEIAQDVIEQRQVMTHNLAVEIANEVGRLFKK